jgi:DHA2 family multidrug resistance protein
VGQSFAFLGLVATLLLQALFTGGLDSPGRVLTFSAFFHTVRLFGGEIGATLMGHYIATQEKLHSFLLGLQVQPGEWVTDGTLRGLTAGLAAKSNGLAAAAGRAVGIVDARVRLQAYTLTFIDAFHLIAWVCVGTLLLAAAMKRAPMNYAELGAVPQTLSAAQKEKP